MTARILQAKTSKYITVQFPLSPKELWLVNEVFQDVKYYVHLAQERLVALTTLKLNNFNTKAMQRHIQTVIGLYHNIDRQESLWNAAIKKYQGTRTSVQLVNWPVTPLNSEFTRNLYYKKNKTMRQVDPNVQRTLNSMGRNYAAMRQKFPQAPLKMTPSLDAQPMTPRVPLAIRVNARLQQQQRPPAPPGKNQQRSTSRLPIGLSRLQKMRQAAARGLSKVMTVW